MLTAVRALKGRVNSAQCAAKRSVGKQANAEAFVPSASGGEPTEQRAGRKKIRLSRSEASYLIFRPASVARACEAHEALTFGLLLGQAKSDGKERSE